jgi:hypothetical protein
MPTPLPAQDYTALARKYVRLAEDPENSLYREQFLDLARVWMEFAMEEAAKLPGGWLRLSDVGASRGRPVRCGHSHSLS